MFEVSKKARELITAFIEEKGEEKSVRMVCTTTECNQPAVGLALSELQEGDKVFNFNGVSFIVDGQLCDMVTPVYIDVVETLSGNQLSISCGIAENACLLAEEPEACRTYCMTCTCQDQDPLTGLSR